LSQNQTWKSWSGYAFESLCIQHVEKIKEALGIHGIFSEESSFVAKGNAEQKGTQIDLLIDRKDQTINLCEIKFYNQSISITASMVENIKQKRNLFRAITKTKKHVFITLVSTYGITENKYSLGFVDNSITMNQLF
jgi:hypothetical protein